MRVIRDVAYRKTHHERWTGDLHLPAGMDEGASPVLLIHGGGWNALDKLSIEPFASLFLQHGRPVFNINYRLLRHAPWPACLEDCAAAAEFVYDGHLAEYGVVGGRPLLVCGASAGGHLAMMAGLRLGRDRAEAIISLCGPALLDFPDGSSQPQFESRAYTREFFGDDHDVADANVDHISPVTLAHSESPPLYCIHSVNDLLVPVSHSRAAVDAWRAAGVPTDLFMFDGPGNSHGIWDSENRANRQPIAPAADAIGQILVLLDGAIASVRTP